MDLAPLPPPSRLAQLTWEPWQGVGSLLVPRALRALASRLLVARLLRASGAVRCSLRDVERTPVGRALVVRGRARRLGTPPPDGDEPAPLFRKLILRTRSATLAREEAIDFALVDESGRLLPVFVRGAHLVPRRLRPTPPADAIACPPLTPGGDGSGAAFPWPAHAFKRASVSEVREGDEVAVFGYRDAFVDPSRQARQRALPLAPCLRSGARIPLLVFSR